jgi:hypothetical protein
MTVPRGVPGRQGGQGRSILAVGFAEGTWWMISLVMEDRIMASLLQIFQTIPDPRDASGRRHPLSAILIHATVATLAGARGYEAIAQFGRDRGAAFAWAVGYDRLRTPCKATFSNVFRALPAEEVERALSRWLQDRQRAGWKRASLDGKTLRGSKDGGVPGVHLLAVFEHEAKAAISQMAVDGKTNEHKAALRMLDLIDVEGKVLTGDPAFCQRDLCEKVVKKGGTTAGR